MTAKAKQKRGCVQISFRYRERPSYRAWWAKPKKMPKNKLKSSHSDDSHRTGGRKKRERERKGGGGKEGGREGEEKRKGEGAVREESRSERGSVEG